MADASGAHQISAETAAPPQAYLITSGGERGRLAASLLRRSGFSVQRVPPVREAPLQRLRKVSVSAHCPLSPLVVPLPEFCKEIFKF